MGIEGTRLFLLTAAIGASCLIVASACSSSSDASNATDAGTGEQADGNLDLGDGGRKASLDDAGACLAADNAAPSCSGVCQAECQVAVTSFKSDVAANIADCLNAGSSANDLDCQAAATHCVNAGALAACTDDAAAAFCTSFITSCPDAVDGGSTDQTQSDCVSLVQGMTDDGRTNLQNCVTEETNNCAGCIASLQTLTLAGSH